MLIQSRSVLLRPCAGWATRAWHGANPLQRSLAPSSLGWGYGNAQLPPVLPLAILAAPGTVFNHLWLQALLNMLMSCICHLQTDLPCSPKPAESSSPCAGTVLCQDDQQQDSPARKSTVFQYQ